ncbi:MAG TPA: peptidylprolyl isomerase [Candidatus Angelobacter sp.]|jgi:peptidyl-prolyl cis-trans isomerase A (cyclophilin A)
MAGTTGTHRRIGVSSLHCGTIFYLLAASLLFGIRLSSQTGKAHTPTPQSKPVTTKKAGAAASPVAIIHTTAGDMKCTLFPDKDPKAVANFIGLAKGTKPWKDPATGKMVRGKPLYDGITFHRTIPDFMIAAGDSTGTGTGDAGFTISDALYSDLLFDQPGRLAMANRGWQPNTSSSQFFITEKELPHLNPCVTEGGCPALGRAKDTGYIIFGQCDENTVELVKKIVRMPCMGGAPCDRNNSKPLNPVKIKHIEIQSGGTAKPAAKKPADKKAAAPLKPTSPKQ